MTSVDDFFGRRGPPRPPGPPPRRDYAFLALLLLLVLLAIAAWYADPAHRPDGDSRIDWPRPAGSSPP